MSYQPPIITEAGLSVPSFEDIQQYYLEQFLNIFGEDVYQGNDSPDIQLQSVMALVAADAMNAAILAYNNRSPLTAIGAALDAIVKINGLTRKAASFSSSQVILTGTPGTQISAGVVQDQNGNKWDLPTDLTIPQGGTLTVTAICETPGAITANANDLSIIATPTSGWSSVTNADAAVVGQPVETDSQLRARQALSVALPSQTMLAGTIAAIAATDGVTRYNVDENPTGATNGNGNPAHSITAVVEGGEDNDVANAIYANRGIGCLTNGTTSIQITDVDTGIVSTIKFSRPTYSPIFVTLNLKMLSGFSSVLTTAVQTAITAYLNSLQIGESLTVSGLYAAAMSVITNISQPPFSITSLFCGLNSNPNTAADIAIAFDHVTQGILGNIVVTTS